MRGALHSNVEYSHALRLCVCAREKVREVELTKVISQTPARCFNKTNGRRHSQVAAMMKGRACNPFLPPAPKPLRHTAHTRCTGSSVAAEAKLNFDISFRRINIFTMAPRARDAALLITRRVSLWIY